MKITLISPYPDITSFGLRSLSSYLKENGFETQMIFLPDPYNDDIVHGVQRYDDKSLDALSTLCQDSDLIGISLMTNFFEGALQITKKLKSCVKAPVIWGGVHPTIRPHESLEHADLICIADGEDALLELAQRMDKGEDIKDVQNIGFMENGKAVINPLRGLSRNLDCYPMPDYSLEDHHILYQGTIRPFTAEILKESLENGTVSQSLKLTGYQTMTGRGCPHKCSYCVNDTIKDMYNNQNYLRWRSSEHVMEEFLWIKKNLPYIGFIWISDDAFFARPKKDLQEFCTLYKEKIGLPFSCLASPMTISEDKMDMLVDAGLIYVQMGVESGAKHMQDIFNRKSMGNERMKKAFHIINKYKDKMYPPSYDLILDVPYETKQDKIDSIKFIAEIPKPFRLQPFSLILYPGTRLFNMAKEDGFICDEKKEIYEKTYTMREPNYFNLIITIAKNGSLPPLLLKFLVSFPLAQVLGSDIMKPFIKVFYLSLKSMFGRFKMIMGRA